MPDSEKSELTSQTSSASQSDYDYEFFYQKNNVMDRIFYMERVNPRMKELLKSQSMMLIKKANYPEKICCGLISQDNVYKLYEWDEENTERGLRLARYG